ncbi:5' nucleotidase, NT5C type [Clostridium chromiireducens]|uniref:Nucleotidase n=1 Tax=Clostridium chromiireducens TaxID=225345 RepID=A0A1V4IC29_9CLOT|nr:hypothetical protein [Clostridium chromiireducens]OPJ57489.1 5' nucleotidase, deoxy (pyrimidine), cytosolic type C protein [Clostridium chromiireducens]RII33601.1 hypothetical protein D2A34_17900 [Clostridium chromiireducens]
MNNLNICIDIDGTITNAYDWLDYANEYFNKNITEDQVTEYEIHQVMGIERHEYEDFYNKNKFKIHSEQKLRDDAKLIITVLYQMHNIHFVTARDLELETLTHLFLRKNEIPYDNLFVLGSHYKVDKAKELNCNIFIEDSYDNAIQLSNSGYKVLLIDTNYNRKPLNNNIVRVNNWKEIFLIINELSSQTKAV